ncbi:LuxR C-terminal-related transcriptional regulator [Corticibacterium sp. UT-5YL-CI-8]|nr:LuxR C-terminal-related transcriptional regulator [Tianweitania sp. UT-5YL-CI-8]
MTATAQRSDRTKVGGRLAGRGDLTAFLMQLCEEVEADCYLLLAMHQTHDGPQPEIVSSNWIYDAIQLAGHALIAALAQGPLATGPGIRPQSVSTAQSETIDGVLDSEEARMLDVLGHGEIFSLRLHVGHQRLFLLLSSADAGIIDPAKLSKIQFNCCYALSQMPELLSASRLQDPLSDRERECLFWVSEGKTTDDVAMILGVSSNTVNSYITHAIQKLSASNRAMAIATAIRNGII